MYFLLFLSFITVIVIIDAAAAQDFFVDDWITTDYDIFVDDNTDDSSFSLAASFPALESIEPEYFSSEPQAFFSSSSSSSSSCLTETPDWELWARTKMRGRRDVIFGNSNFCPAEEHQDSSSPTVAPFDQDQILDFNELPDKVMNLTPGKVIVSPSREETKAPYWEEVYDGQSQYCSKENPYYLCCYVRYGAIYSIEYRACDAGMFYCSCFTFCLALASFCFILFVCVSMCRRVL
jgi:hypothetical protein